MTSVPQTTPAVLDRIARALPDHEALVTPEKTLTFTQLREEVRRAAAAMVDLGVNPGDRVAVWSPNTWHWVVACLATHHAGAVLVPLNTRYTATEATDILARTQAPLLIAAGEFLGADRSDSERPGKGARHEDFPTRSITAATAGGNVGRCAQGSPWRPSSGRNGNSG